MVDVADSDADRAQQLPHNVAVGAPIPAANGTLTLVTVLVGGTGQRELESHVDAQRMQLKARPGHLGAGRRQHRRRRKPFTLQVPFFFFFF